MTIVEAKWNDETINLSKSSFMLFLYNNENDINERDLDFSYRLTKYLKKLRIGNDVHDALPQEQDVGWFFSRANELQIAVEWRQIFDNKTSDYKPIIFNKELPLEIELLQDKNKIQCILKNRLAWLCSFTNFWIQENFTSGIIICMD